MLEKTGELSIEAALEWLCGEAEIMHKKELQMTRFLKSASSSQTEPAEENEGFTKMEDLDEVEKILVEIEAQKEGGSEMMEFFRLFEDMRDYLNDSAEAERRLVKGCKEIFTGKFWARIWEYFVIIRGTK